MWAPGSHCKLQAEEETLSKQTKQKQLAGGGSAHF